MNPNYNIQPDELVSPHTPTPSEQTLEHAPRAIRTFEEDIADAMRDGKGSVLGIALAEQKRKDDTVSFGIAKKNNSWLILLGVLFFVSALGILGYIGYTKFVDNIPIADPSNSNSSLTINSLVSADKTTPVDIDKLLPKNGITQSLLYASGGSDLSTRTLQIVVPVTKSAEGTVAADTKTTMSRLAPHSPAILTRSINGNVVMGIYAGDVAIPFIMFKTNSYEGAFSGLLDWEDFMSDDLFTFMGVNLSNIQSSETITNLEDPLNATSTATSTSSTSTPAKVIKKPVSVPVDMTKFVDRTVKNKDMRVIQDGSGKIYFLYGFANKDTVIITTAPEAFFEISNRLH